MRHLKHSVLAVVCLTLGIWLVPATPALAGAALAISSIYTVNSNLDDDDGSCDSSPGDCTLREAINAANANSNADTIEFDLGSGTPTIAVSAAGLPTLTQPVTISGNTGGATRIELNGTGTGSNVDGLKITGGSSTLRYLVINRFGGDGIEMNTNGGNLVESCYIGFGADGTTQLENSGEGVYILNSSNNTIGGTTASTRNIITSNDDGIFLQGTGGGSTTGNVVQGNYIGTDVTGMLDRGGDGNGMSIYSAHGNTIGGTVAGSGNVISGNSGVGMEVFQSNDNFIQGNIIGLAVDGTTDLGNFNEGIQLTDSSNNTVGGTTHTANTCDGACNLISGNEAEGINLFRSFGTGANNNVIQGNYIGTDRNGTADRGNLYDGIFLSGVNNNSIGGTGSGAGNLISGNDDNGILLSGRDTVTNTIQGNIIGLDKTGTNDLGNSDDGIRVTGNSLFGYPGANTIGGTSSSARNIISGNDSVGIRINGSGISGITILGNYIGTDATGTLDRGSMFSGIYINAAQNTVIGGETAGAGNLVSGNNGSGIYQENGASSTTIQGNFVGTNAAGTADLGNSFDGIFIGSGTNTIGGTSANARNVLSGNDANGLEIFGNTATLNLVQGNYMGLNAAGTGTLGNTYAGIYLNGSSNNTVGGTASGARNLISGNFGDGIDIQFGATGNTVSSNYIGTDVSGTLDRGNTYDGIYIDSASNTIGGTAANAGNLISGNNQNAIQLNGTSASGNLIAGNFLGTNASGTGDLGNTYAGVLVNNAPNNTIGGTTTAHRNLISGNDDAGVDIFGSSATGNAVQGNYIGTQTDGTSALANAYVGVWIEGSASTNSIGGTASGAGNIIAFNTQDGVFVESGAGNQIRRNSIFSNGDLGIDLGTNGVTANDTGNPPDTDTGANNLQNFPLIATAQQGSTIITGSFSSTPNTSFTLEFFSSPAADGSGNGEGKTFLCDAPVTTDGSGAAAINVTCSATTTAGNLVTATATRSTAPFDTSEFSNALSVSAPTSAVLLSSSARFKKGQVTVKWTTGNEVAVLGFDILRQEKNQEELELNPDLILPRHPGELLSGEYQWQDTTVQPGKQYTFRVRVHLTDGTSEYGEPMQVKVPRQRKTCEGKLKAVKLSSPQKGEIVQSRRVALDWKNVPCATSYSLILRHNGATGKIVEQADGITASEYVSKALKRGETYYWQVRACNSAGCGKARGGLFVIRP